jgi:hypothetical protein
VAKPAIELIETRQGCEMLESTPRYNVMSLATWLGPLRRFVLAHPLGR